MKMIFEFKSIIFPGLENRSFLGYKDGIFELKASTKFIALRLEQKFTNQTHGVALKFLSELRKAKIIS